MYVCLVHMYAPHVHKFAPYECLLTAENLEVGVKVSRTLTISAKDCCELLCGCWECNPGSLDEQPVLLAPELSLQPIDF